MTSIHFDLLKEDELEAAHAIELASYPADEAASLDVFRYRQSRAPELFLAAYTLEDSGRTLIGYVCATLSPAKTLTHESMSTHVPGSSSVCIHSICVSPECRRQGVALSLLNEYISRLQYALKSGVEYKQVLLIAHEELRSLYEKAGFEWVGKSSVVHGANPWFEMRRDLSRPSQPVAPPPGIWEALQRASGSKNRPQALALAAFPNGAQDLVSNDGMGTLSNKFDLLCPRSGCGSIILKAGVGSLVERASMQLDPPQRTTPNPLVLLPPPPETMNWWLVTPNAMAFENIGFTRAVVSDDTTKRVKLLICAECDLGPLGWCEEGGSEFWLACSRVGYQQ
ncbi:uncharacterized protein FIBRA_06531 [Fibroporia radiculosa]|uniref:N-acetyltransferase domain-containing protein n=1 Tax=Fibroporia radiculosa TaxID=599839 RepID=J4H446_9APHY|nr:uncharacterized protein FIBRA_06531 [Fibroporia radiculosa]CCM04359.1 predicted protein [Fibroporia radiculosa]